MTLGPRLHARDNKLYHPHLVLATPTTSHICTMPRSSTLRPRQVANRTRNPWRTPVPRRPRDLLAKSAEVAREPTTPAELFTSALLNQDGLGCPGDGTESNDVYDNVRIDLYIERKEVSIYMDPSADCCTDIF